MTCVEYLLSICYFFLSCSIFVFTLCSSCVSLLLCTYVSHCVFNLLSVSHCICMSRCVSVCLYYALCVRYGQRLLSMGHCVSLSLSQCVLVSYCMCVKCVCIVPCIFELCCVVCHPVFLCCAACVSPCMFALCCACGCACMHSTFRVCIVLYVYASDSASLHCVVMCCVCTCHPTCLHCASPCVFALCCVCMRVTLHVGTVL
ncbi:hypothetical protein FKM82_018289 [Ascaphus truei]